MKKNLLKLSTLFVLMTFVLGIVNAQVQIPSSYSPTTMTKVVKTQPSYVPDFSGKAIVLSESFDGTTFPPTGWTATAGSGTYNWVRVTSGTHPTCSPHSGDGMAWYDCWDAGSGQWASLASSVVNLTGNTGTFVAGLWMMHDGTYTGDHVEVYVNTTASLTGATLLGDVQNNDGTTGWGQHEFSIPATYNTATNYIIFKGISAYGNGMFIDDIYVTSPEANDVGLTEITAPGAGILVGSVTPEVVVKNFGSAAQTNVPVKYKIGVGGTPVVATVASLASGATTSVTFPAWTATLGSYDFIFYSDLTGDAVRSNDTMKRTVNVYNSLTKVYCFANNTAASTFTLQTPSAGFTALGGTSSWYARSGEFVRTGPGAATWYVMGSDFNLYSVDTLTGAQNLIGATGFSTGFLCGMAYDYTTSTMYATGISGTYPGFTLVLYTVNLSTGAITPVATCPTAGCFFEIACSNTGQLYVIEGVPSGNGKIYAMDKTTAAVTLIGTDLGDVVSSNFQDIDFDDNNTLYFTASKGSDGVMDGLYTINTTTGTATLIDVFNPLSTQVVGVGIHRDHSDGIKEVNTINSLNIFPNPATNLVSVINRNNEKIQTLKVYSLSGQLIYSENVNHFATTINVANWDAGYYLVQVQSNSGTYTQKITVIK